MNNRRQRQILNSGTALIYQLVLIISSFILPKFYLQFYGSEINGLIVSITNFLSFISLMDLGIGAVIQSNLYKPLASRDYESVSKIYVSAYRFFKRIVIIFIIYLIALAFIYPIYVNNFEYFFTVSLIFILAISLVAEYLFGVVNQYLLNADQKIYIPQIISSVLILVNIVISVCLIINGASVHMVKIVNSSILIIKPIVLAGYVKKNYQLDKKVKFSGEPIKQKWNGLAQHLASFVTGSTDTIVLTFFSSLEDVSIYYVYNLVQNGIKQLIMAFMSGTEALFGNMIANNERENLLHKFLDFEWVMHTIITFLFSCTASLILSFVMIYTSKVSDADYYQPLFGICITIAVCFWCIRTVYFILVKAAGHYKQTQLSSIIEMIINLAVSILIVTNYGLVGVAIGTLVSMMYRTVCLAYYIKNIIEYQFSNFIKHLFVDCICFITIYSFSLILLSEPQSILYWILNAVIIGIFGMIIEVIINYIFYRNYMNDVLKYISRRI